MKTTEQQLAELTAIIDAGKATADTFFERGRLNWKLDRRGAAMSDYETAAQLDPGSPAVQALEMAHQVMDFYNHDLYNP